MINGTTISSVISSEQPLIILVITKNTLLIIFNHIILNDSRFAYLINIRYIAFYLRMSQQVKTSLTDGESSCRMKSLITMIYKNI